MLEITLVGVHRFVQWDAVTFAVLPVGNTLRDFQLLLLLIVTLRVGECITGAGGEGGPRGVFGLILNL